MLRSCNGKNVRFRGAVYDRWVFAQLVSFYEKRLVPMGVVVESVFEDIGSGDKEKTWVVQRGTSSLEVSVSQAAGEVSVTVSTDRAAHHWNITPSRGQPPAHSGACALPVRVVCGYRLASGRSRCLFRYICQVPRIVREGDEL